jgi:Kef-type K+ transport system membrane component KefB
VTSDTTAHTPSRPAAVRGLLVGTGLVVVSAVLIVVVLGSGAGQTHPASAANAAASSAGPYPRLLITLPVILAACYLAGAVSRWLRQPAVIGEIIAGVLLGPSLLGLGWPAAFHWLFPRDVVSTINVLAQIGLIFFMYMIGAELNRDVAIKRGMTATAVIQANIAIPMLCGVLLALAMYHSFGGSVSFLTFALFIAITMSVTAFPVLARILTDRRMQDTPLGTLALACAAVGDVVAWCLLAMVTAIAHGGTATRMLLTVAEAVAFVALMLLFVRPLLSRWIPRLPATAVLPVILAGVMLFALVTNQIGIHPIFGAFMFGVIAPRSAPEVNRAGSKLKSITVTLLLPLFFVYTGLDTKFGLLGANGRLWSWCVMIVTVAILSKWGSATAAARLAGVNWRESFSLGALMNCRGLTELVVLSVGLQLHVISSTVFTMLVIMTLVSTVATAPGLTLVARFRRGHSDEDPTVAAA